MARKSFSEIVSDMIDYIRFKDSTLDTEEGSIIRDVVIEAPADSIEGIYVENEHVSLIHSFLNYQYMSDDELEALAYNYGITRTEAIEASGSVTFRRTSAPTEDILIPQGTIVSTRKTVEEDAINFITTEDVSMLSAIASSYYNSTTGYWEVSASVQAEESGTDGNVSANSITVIASSVNNIDSITNSIAFSNGTAQESNESLADRSLLALTGNNVGTEDGYLSTVKANAYVYDALLVGPGDDLMTRDSGLGGKVDIYISANLTNSNTYTSTTQIYTYTDQSEGSGATDTDNDVTIANQPVRAVASIVGSVYGTFLPDVDYELQTTSTSNVFYGSTSATDKIHWLKDVPTEGETITITYTYYSLMTTLDTAIDNNKPVNADVLVKLATSISINCSVTVYADSTIDESGQSDFEDNVESTISTFLTSNTLGRDIQQSDIVDAIYNISGVDRVALPFSALNATGKTGYTTGVNDNIPLDESEYGIAGTVVCNSVLAS